MTYFNTINIKLKVTIAAKMENSGIQDRIQMTVYSQKILSDCFPEFQYTKRDKQISVNVCLNFIITIIQFE